METTRREFARGALAALASAPALAGAAAESPAAETTPTPDATPAERGIRVRFLGSGAAGWDPSRLKKHPHTRRQSSVLLDGRALIDFTQCSFDKLPEGCRPEVLFQTHSHGDHYNPTAAARSGVRRMYVQESWAAAAAHEVRAAAAKLSLPAPQVIPLPFGKAVSECGMKFTGVPANHSTSRVCKGVLERTSLYLVEKGPTRLLYATDTGGICGDAARMIGIDPHIPPSPAGSAEFLKPFLHRSQAITALIMEATNADLEDDFRIFVHSSVQTVARIATMLKRHGRLALPEGQNVWITHLGLKWRDWPAAKIDAILPHGLRAAWDGMETVLG